MKKVRLIELYESYIDGNPELDASGSGDFRHVDGAFDPYGNGYDAGFGSTGNGSGEMG